MNITPLLELVEMCLGRRSFRCLHTDPPRLVHHPPLDLRLPSRRETTHHPPALLALSCTGKLLIAFVAFIDQHLVHYAASHEKIGVFLKLLNDLLRLTPLELIPIVLTKSMVRCLVSIRINKKQTLYALAGVTLSNLIATSTTSVLYRH